MQATFIKDLKSEKYLKNSYSDTPDFQGMRLGMNIDCQSYSSQDAYLEKLHEFLLCDKCLCAHGTLAINKSS